MSPLLRNFLEASAAAGVPPDHVRYLRAAGKVMHPKQLAASAAAWECDEEGGPVEIGYGGARGGGKSGWCVLQLGVIDCQRQEDLKCLFLRKIGKAASESLGDLRRQLLMNVPHKYSEHRGRIYFPRTNAQIITGHYQNENDINAYLGLEYDVIAVEEATTLTEDKWQAIRTCNRTSKPNWRPRIYATTNPGGIGHTWFRKRFIIPYKNGEETETRFIPATVDDNPFVDGGYRDNLDRLVGWRKRAWRFGDWDIDAGQFFSNFSESAHVKDRIDERLARDWFLGFDYGFAHPTVAILGFFDGDGNCYIVDEHGASKWLVERHAEAIHAMIGRHKKYVSEWRGVKEVPLTVDDLSWLAAGGDIFAKRTEDKTIAEQYREFGFKFVNGTTDRINSAAELMRLMGEPNGREPVKMFIHRRCRRLIEQIPEMQHDPKRPEDILKVDVNEMGEGGDDYVDATRYGVSYRKRRLRTGRLSGT